MEFLFVFLITMTCLFCGWIFTAWGATDIDPTNTKAGWIGMAVGAVVGLIFGLILASTGVFTL